MSSPTPPESMRRHCLLAATTLLLAQAPVWAQDSAAAPESAVDTTADGSLPTVPVQAPADDTPTPERAADSSRRNLLQLGVFRINNLDKSRPLQSSVKPGALSLLVPAEFDSPGTGASVSTEETLALIYSFFLTDNLALKFEGGIPARFSIQGKGIVQPSALAPNLAVDLGADANNPLAKVTQWSPVLLLQYVFRAPDKSLRPYAGVGMTYTWFKKVRLDKDFENDLNTKFGTALAGANLKTGATHVDAAASDDLAPVFNLGLNYDITPQWSVASSVSYSLLKTTANITIDAEDGTRLSTSRTKIDLNPMVMSLLVGYRFSLF